MRERDFGKRSGLKVPPANIGGMRFPQDMDQAVALIRHAIDSGMRYIDTSRGYGDSELKLARALKNGYRQKVILSTKWSPWAMRVADSDTASAVCVRRRIEEQMRRLEVDYLDFYQVWSINSREDYRRVVSRRGMLAGIRKAMDEGLVLHTGFTTHDEPRSLMKYIDEVDWCEVILFTYNMLNTAYAPVIAAAHERGIGTIVMNPVGGGKLAEASPVLMELARRVGAASAPELALRYVLSNPNVDTLIAGIAKKPDVDGAIAAAEKGPFTRSQIKAIETFTGKVAEQAGRFCTGCEYCMPCPHGVKIPAVMGCMEELGRFPISGGSINATEEAGNREASHFSARTRYKELGEAGAEACEECGECLIKCTQKLHIIEEMRKARRHFGRM